MRDMYTGIRAMTEILQHFGAAKDLSVLQDGKEVSDEQLTLEKCRNLMKKFALHSDVQNCPAEKIAQLAVPALVRLRNGHFAVLAGCSATHAFFLDPALREPLAVPLERVSGYWDGKAVVFSAAWNYAYFRKKYQLDWFLSIIHKYRRYIYEVLTAGIFLQLMGIGMPLITQVVVDKVIGNRGLSTLTVIGCGMLMFIFLQAVLSGIRTYILSHTTNKLDAVLGARLFAHLIHLPLPYYENRQVGDSLMRLEALTSIREFLTGKGISALLDVFFSVTFIAFMLYYSVPLTLIVCMIIPLYVMQSIWSVPLVQEKINDVWRTGTQTQSFLVESVTNMETVKSLSLEPQFQYRWEKLLAGYMRSNFGQAKLQVLIDGFSGTVQTTVSLLLLWYGGHMVMNGEFTLGQLIAFQMIAGQAMEPLNRLLTIWPSVQQAGLALERMGDILNAVTEEDIEKKERADKKPVSGKIRGDIIFRHVSFRYRPDYPLVLNDITLEMFAGRCIGIVGRSGSGKSTLTKLIQRLYLPDSGTILLDGKPLSAYDLQNLRKQIGVVLQENYLFNGSIRENISLAKPEADMADVIQAAKLAGAHEFILALPEGYDTKAGERGSALSGGQKQRIAIARALLLNPSILIMDEATSALDPKSEQKLMEHMEEIRKGRTVIIIAHRLSTVMNCDMVFVMEHGDVADVGTPDDLAHRPGIYQELYLQQREEMP